MRRAPLTTVSIRAAVVLATLGAASTVHAQEILLDANAPTEEAEPAVFWAPYAFASATYDFALGFGSVATGYLQDQLSFFGNVIVSTNETAEIQLGLWGAHFPRSDRLFADGWLSLGNYTQLRAYVGNDAAGNRSGANESAPDNFIQDSAVQLWSEWRLSWILPIGKGKDAPIQTYRLHHGILDSAPTGGDVWNPLKTGRTALRVRPFYRRQEFDLAPSQGQIASNGLALMLEYDNRDFPRNPTFGSRQAVSLWRDFGALDSTNSWTAVEAEASKFFDLGTTDWSRQQVLALGVWTVDSLSWEETEFGPENAPPYFYGATLGGRRRLRAYPTNRFNDRAGIHYWVEYRMVPGWQPLPDVEELDVARIDWWQIALFAELGRVAPNWSLEEFHRDMKWDVGVSLRLMARKTIARVDFAVGPEDFGIWIDLGEG
ncbi:MAG: BamA/TamA family outer membrane protein, partial [Planctomycetota bacterium]